MNEYPMRPTTDDFLELSKVMRDFDDKLEEMAVPDVIDIDSDTLMYCATQRAFMALGITTKADLIERLDEASRYAIVWIDGYTIGRLHGAEKEDV